jgi:hypothetical protein
MQKITSNSLTQQSIFPAIFINNSMWWTVTRCHCSSEQNSGIFRSIKLWRSNVTWYHWSSLIGETISGNIRVHSVRDSLPGGSLTSLLHRSVNQLRDPGDVGCGKWQIKWIFEILPRDSTGVRGHGFLEYTLFFLRGHSFQKTTLFLEIADIASKKHPYFW